MERQWKDNPFWDNEDKTAVKAILQLTEEGKTTSQVLTVKKYNGDDINPDWADIMDTVGEELIDKNTKERIEKKAKEKEAHKLRNADIENSKRLEKLFEAKLEAFEIDEIKKSTNRELKTRLRRSKSLVEVNLYSMMIMMEEIENAQEGSN